MPADKKILPNLKNNEDTVKCLVCKQIVVNERLRTTCKLYEGSSSPSVVEALGELLPDVLTATQAAENLGTALDLFVCRRCYNTLGMAMKKKQEALESFQALRQLTSPTHTTPVKPDPKDRTLDDIGHSDIGKPLIDQPRCDSLDHFTRSKRCDTPDRCSCLPKEHIKDKQQFGKSRKRSHTFACEAGPNAKKINLLNADSTCNMKSTENRKEECQSKKSETKKNAYENNELAFETRSGTRYGRNNQSKSSLIKSSRNTRFHRSSTAQGKKATNIKKVFSRKTSTTSAHKKTVSSSVGERFISSQGNNKHVTAPQDDVSKQVAHNKSIVCISKKSLIDADHRVKQKAVKHNSRKKLRKVNIASKMPEENSEEAEKSYDKKKSETSDNVSYLTRNKGNRSLSWRERNSHSNFSVRNVDNIGSDGGHIRLGTSSSVSLEEKSTGFDVDSTNVDCSLGNENLLSQRIVESLECNNISENNYKNSSNLDKTKDNDTAQVELGSDKKSIKQGKTEKAIMSSENRSTRTCVNDLSTSSESLSGSKHLSCAICEKQFCLHASILRHIRNGHDKDANDAKALVIDSKNSRNVVVTEMEEIVKRLDATNKEEDKTEEINYFPELDQPPSQNCSDKKVCEWVHSDSETTGDSDYFPDIGIITPKCTAYTSGNQRQKVTNVEVLRSKRGRLKDGQNKPWCCSLCPRKYYHKRDGIRHIVRNHGSSFDDARVLIKSSGKLEPKAITRENIKVSKVDVYQLDTNFSQDRNNCTKHSEKTLAQAIVDGLVWQCGECERRMVTRKGILRHLDVVHNISGPWARYHVHQVGLNKGSTLTPVKSEGRLDRDVLCVLCGRDYDNKYIASRHFKSQHPDVPEEQECKALIKKSEGAKLIVVTVMSQPSKQQFYQIDDVGRISRVKPLDTSLLKALVSFGNLASCTEENGDQELVDNSINNEGSGSDKEKNVIREDPNLPKHIPLTTKTMKLSDKDTGSAFINGTGTGTDSSVINIDTDHSYLSTLDNENRHGLEKDIVLWKCDICNTNFKEKVLLTKHKRLHLCAGKWVCRMCGKMFPKNFYLLSHIAGVHKIVGNKALEYMKESDEKCSDSQNGCSKIDESEHVQDTAKNKNCITTTSTDIRRTCEGVETICDEHEAGISGCEDFKTDVLNDEGITVKNIPICHICDQIFENRKEQNCHLQEIHGIATQSCTECDEIFLNMSLLQKHLRQIHKDVLSKTESCHPCTVCESLFSSKRELSVHLKEHDASDYKCSVCGGDYQNLSNLSLHMKTHSLTKILYACSVCGITVPDKRHLEKHVENHYEKLTGPFKCTTCSKQYPSIMSLKKHKAGHGRFVCDYCNRIYESSSSLNSHMKSHIDPNGFRCIKCNKSFQSASGYKKHMGKHAGTSIVVCHLCGKVLNTASYLQKHIEVMHRSKKTRRLKDRKCKLCGKTFVRPYQMKRHLVVHTKERPFECEYCSKTFGFRTMYLAHLRKHPEYTPYVCTLCGKTFQVGKEYLDHRNKMHPGIPDSILSEKCQFCDHIFRSERALLLHIDQVHKEHQHLEKHEAFRYSCVICSKPFLYKISLNRHLASEHKRSEQLNPTASNSDSENLVSSDEVGGNCDNEVMNEQIVTECHFICDICKQPFDNWNELESHLNKEHGEGTQIQVYITSDVQSNVDVEEQPTVQLSNDPELSLDTVCEVVVSTDLF